MNNTPARNKVVDVIDYLKSTASILIKEKDKPFLINLKFKMYKTKERYFLK
ncbi:hypothetical protein [Candidatus Phytoplasma tritici]|uniref:hypothetical protein n=1 Tax=Candidatus Phytoplasma tritici TaxID=321961 RepID=UPI000424E3BF|nr:hypothetical protein [Candidatus Phytoplasma tritici]